MAASTFADRVAMARRVLEWFREHKAELNKKGLQADFWIANLESSVDGAVHTDQDQETLKARLKATTNSLTKWDRQMYEIASGAIDAARGSYGKSSPDAAQIARMRSALHRPPKNPPTLRVG